MSVVAILGLALCLYLLFKMAGFVFKLVLLLLVLTGIYWLAAPLLDLPLPL